ncbi:MAG: ribosome small subunit-dependent GTPase A [Clostridiales bacterium]|jgi:ribosome biogenesis GTPase|nr:ribosome small subunit-dependent GTPase A [Clostridiales bacterium]
MSDVRLTGRIVKAVAGIYTVDVPGIGRFACPGRGLFRKSRITPVPGDIADINSVDYEKSTGYLYSIHPRVNELIRPKAANVTLALLVFSLVSPEVSLLVVDTMLAYLESLEIKPVLCVNKLDITEPARVEAIKRLYAPAGYAVLPVSAVTKEGLEAVRTLLNDNIAILAGPSGVGKSSLINALFPHICQETGELSRRIERGKNTTRSCELFPAGGGQGSGYIADTPGFTSLEEINLPAEQLMYYFPEFSPFLGKCFYGDCMHITEHDCAVKAAVGAAVTEGRYESYKALVGKNRGY